MSEFLKLLPYIAIVITLLMVIMFAFLIGRGIKDHKRLSEGPFADATITDVQKRRDTNRSGIRYKYCCDLRYIAQDGKEYQSYLELPCDAFEIVPVGGKVRITYNPRNPKRAIFVQTLFMRSPEYIAAMEAKGYKYIDGAFVPDVSACSTEKESSIGITMKRKDS